MADLRTEGDFVGPGERKTAAYLQENLPRSWVVIFGKELVNPRGHTTEADFVIVGTHTVFAVEEKAWRGRIYGDETSWILPSGESLRSPLNKAAHVARRLAAMLKHRIPGLGSSITGHFVYARVILSEDAVELFVRDPRVKNEVLDLNGCEDRLKEFDRSRADSSRSIERWRNQIIQELSGLRSRPPLPNRIGDYEVLELLDGHGPIRSLRARHPDGTECLLKLIERRELADPERQASHEAALLREYDALKKLAQSGVAPEVAPYFSFGDGAFWVVPVRVVDGSTLRSDRADATPVPSRILGVAEKAFEALNTVHGHGVVHRSISPDRILIQRNGQVLFTDFTIARMEGETTIAGVGEDLDPDHAFRAPECLEGFEFSTRESDVFSLAASLLYWAGGYVPQLTDKRHQPFPALKDLRDDLGPLAESLSAILASCLVEDPKQRPSAEQVLHRLRELRPQEAPAGPSDEELVPGTMLDDRHRILRVLGSGGTATTYLVEDQTAEHEYVLKRIHNPEHVARLAKAEYRTLLDLRHPGVPRIFEIYPANHPFHLKLEYVRGSSLKDVWDQHKGNPDSVIRIGCQVLDVLEYLESQNLIHRDVSPGNILIPDEDEEAIRLIDFGMATDDQDAASAVGTPPFRPPEVERGGRWTNQGDQYSLGVVLFKLATGRLPYAVIDGRPQKDKIVLPGPEENKAMGAQLLRTLLRAANPEPARRFESAAAFRAALEACSYRDASVETDGEERINPFVDELRRAYRNSRIGNVHNRGLESAFAARTYVPTRLDSHLLPQVLAGQVRLVILTGNPGDGKTAFLQRVEQTLRQEGATVESRDGAGWRIRYEAHRFGALYDASASRMGRSADALVADLLQPLAGPDEPPQGYTALLAVNDGRLLDYFERYGELRYRWLWERLRPQVEKTDAKPSDGVVLVDLKHRSLVARTPEEPSLFTGILDLFSDPAHWRVCAGCAARKECPILANVQSLRDEGLARSVRRRLHTMTLAAHWKRERRATIRDLRSALAFLITHDLGCSDIHQERAQGVWPLASPDRLYFNAAFSAAAGGDLLLETWQDLDPALVPHPRLDRFIHFHRTREQAESIRNWFLSPRDRIDLPIPVEPADRTARVGQIKRRLAFEASEVPAEWAAADDSVLLPYRHFRSFREALLGTTPDEEVRDYLLRALSLADGVPQAALAGGLALRVAITDDVDFAVIKHFPADDFQISRPDPAVDLIESVPDHLELRSRAGATLEIGLDLWELLGRAADGYLGGPEEQQAIQEEIEVFKSRLLVQRSVRVALIEAGCRAHTVALNGASIVRHTGAEA